MVDQIRLEELISAIQKAIRWCEVNDSRYFAQELIDMGTPHAVFGQLRIIAAEDIGLADPSMVSYVSECLNCVDDLIEENEIELKDVKNYPELCEIIDCAVIAEAISYKSRLLDMATFATLFDIYKREKFKRNRYEYFQLFVDALVNDDEQKALYYAFIVDIILGDREPILRVIRKNAGKRNGALIREWTGEYEKHQKFLNLTGSIVLLCRDLNFTHGEYKDAMEDYLSIPIKAAGIPDRAYDMHTHEGRKKGRGLDYFFNVSGTVKNERKELKNDWEEVGKDAFYRADEEKLADGKKIIKEIKETKAAEAIKAAKAAKSGKSSKKKCQAPTGVMTI
jgi:hypothetical protein